MGEGSHGSEGFVACLDEARRVGGGIYFDPSDPCDDIAAGTVTASSTAD